MPEQEINPGFSRAPDAEPLPRGVTPPEAEEIEEKAEKPADNKAVQPGRDK